MNTKPVLTYKFDRKKSWEGQTWYDLSNGASVCVEWNKALGYDFVRRIDLPDGTMWCCSDGIEFEVRNSKCASTRKVFSKHVPLPDFARPWVRLSNITLMVFPDFLKLPYENTDEG